MRRFRWLAAALPLVVAASNIAIAQTPACQAADGLAGSLAPLPNVAAALKSRAPLKVLSVGSAKAFGPGNAGRPDPGNANPQPAPQADQGASARTVPSQMAKAMQAEMPGLRIELTMRGERGMDATEMAALIRAALEAERYQLVLWQTGTVEAVHNASPADFAQALSDGASAVQEHSADLVLIDPQYSRFLQTNSNLEPYIQDMQQTAAMPGVMLFHRFDLMREWAMDGRLDLEHTSKADRKAVIDQIHACLGEHLARMITAGARL